VSGPSINPRWDRGRLLAGRFDGRPRWCGRRRSGWNVPFGRGSGLSWRRRRRGSGRGWRRGGWSGRRGRGRARQRGHSGVGTPLNRFHGSRCGTGCRVHGAGQHRRDENHAAKQHRGGNQSGRAPAKSPKCESGPSSPPTVQLAPPFGEVLNFSSYPIFGRIYQDLEEKLTRRLETALGPPEDGPSQVLENETRKQLAGGTTPAFQRSPVPGVDSAGRPNQCGA
jgi:hypothetical protein